MQGTGQESKASNEEIMAHVNREGQKPTGAEARKQHHFEENELPWSEAEELLLPIRSSRTHALHPRSMLRTIAVFAILFSMASGVVWASTPLMSNQKGADIGKPLQLPKKRSGHKRLRNKCVQAGV